MDGEESTEFVIQRFLSQYIRELAKKAKLYVQAINDLCKISEVARSFLDKLNLHRLIELYDYTLAFGHSGEFMEFVFGATHQPLKNCIVRKNIILPMFLPLNIVFAWIRCAISLHCNI